jgi:restriction endonuclease S subunit
MYYLHSDEGQRILFADVKAGSHHNLTLEDIRKFEIPIPTQDEQNLITSLLSDIDAEISELEGQREKTVALKQGYRKLLRDSLWKTMLSNRHFLLVLALAAHSQTRASQYEHTYRDPQA